MSTRLIINADDFGFSVAVTDGILRSHRDGVLTSTTLMTTMPDRDRAIDLAREHPGLGVGIHLSLTQGEPRTGCRRLLSRAHGTFHRSLPRLFWALRSAAARREAQEELTAQIAYALGRGLIPTHVDSHKHVCHLPALHRPLIAACQATGVRWVRTAREVAIAETGKGSVGYRVLASFARSLASKLPAAGLRTNDWFFGLATTGRMDVAVWKALVAGIPPGVGEVMVHPGLIRDLTPELTRLLRHRLVEMEALCDPELRAILAAANIQRTHYGTASGAAGVGL